MKQICGVALSLLAIVILSAIPSAAQIYDGNSIPLINRNRPADIYREAIRRARIEKAASLNDLSSCLVATGNLNRAASTLAESIRLNKNQPMAYIRLARMYAKLNRWKDAVAAYRPLMYFSKGKYWGSSVSNDYDQLIDFTFALQKAGVLGEAKKVYQKAIVMAPSDASRYLYQCASDKNLIRNV